MDEYFGDVLMGVIADIRSVMVVISDGGNPVPKQYLHEPTPLNHGKRFETSRQNSNRNNHWNNHRLQQRTRSFCRGRNTPKGLQNQKNNMVKHGGSNRSK